MRRRYCDSAYGDERPVCSVRGAVPTELALSGFRCAGKQLDGAWHLSPERYMLSFQQQFG